MSRILTSSSSHGCSARTGNTLFNSNNDIVATTFVTVNRDDQQHGMHLHMFKTGGVGFVLCFCLFVLLE